METITSAPAPRVNEITSAKANSLLKGRSSVRVLEAGCGSTSHIAFDIPAYIVGIDISQQQLDRNEAIQERILGDIQTYTLPKGRFDVVVCWMVLEHLAQPRDALLNMFSSVKTGGLVILGFPNLLSIKGIVTKFTPFWFHKAYYRFLRYTSKPFPTYLRTAIMPRRVAMLAERNGFAVEFCHLTQETAKRESGSRARVLHGVLAGIDGIVKTVSLGRAGHLLLDTCVLIVRKHNDPLSTALK